MTAWTCPECASRNADREAECAVCGAERPAAPDTTVEASGPHAVTSPATGRHGTDLDDGRDRWLPGPVAPRYRRRGRPANRWTLWAPVGALALAMAVITGVKVVPALLRADPHAPVDPTTAPVAVPPSTPSPTQTTFAEESTPSLTPSDDTNLVTVDPLAAVDPRAQAVSAVLYQYFSAINNRDFAAALSMYDPAGVVNPDDPSQAEAFSRALSTTYDSEVRILGIATDTSGEGAVQVSVTFRSRQDPGYGPKPDPNETCTDWALTLTLTQGDLGGYRLLSSTGSHSTCP